MTFDRTARFPNRGGVEVNESLLKNISPLRTIGLGCDKVTALPGPSFVPVVYDLSITKNLRGES